MIKKIIVVVAFMLTGFSLTAMSASAEEITDLFLQKEVTYSGVEGGKIGENWKYPQFVGEKAVDGDETTRWSADKQDEQWLIVDLGEVKNIGELVLQLHAESPVYEILVSTDGESYQSIFKEENGQGGQPTKKYIDGNNVQARFVKYQQMKMWQHTNKQFYSSSIISFEAYEKKRLPEAIKLLTENLTISEKRKQQLAFEVSPDGVDITEDQIEWSSSDPTIVTVDQTGNLTAVKQLTLKNSGENKKEQKNGGNNGHLNTSTGVDQTGTKQVKPSSQGGFRKASQFLPSTGEKKSIALVIIGLLVIASGCLLVFRKSKSKK